MTNKPTIINGIDVSRCEKQGETISGITCGNGERIRLANEVITKHRLCKDNPNCYYKQLARKELECEELKKNIEHWKMEHKEAKAKAEWTYDLVKKRLGQQLDKLKAENTKFEQTLAKIKEISEVEIECKAYETEHDCFNETRCKTLNEHIDFIEQILKLISEVEDEN